METEGKRVEGSTGKEERVKCVERGSECSRSMWGPKEDLDLVAPQGWNI